nr:hypothetical protein [Nonomuraea basaltis]
MFLDAIVVKVRDNHAVQAKPGRADRGRG